jgi:hypothetical protein
MRRRPDLASVYDLIPRFECKGLCQDSCGPITMTVEEDRRIRARGVHIPPIEESLAALDHGVDYYCPALKDGRCSVYPDRPTICRLWGATESMPCPHGCRPANPLSQAQSFELLRQAAHLGGGMVSPVDGGGRGAP